MFPNKAVYKLSVFSLLQYCANSTNLYKSFGHFHGMQCQKFLKVTI